MVNAARRSRFRTRLEKKPSRFLADIPPNPIDKAEFEALRAARLEVRDRTARTCLKKMNARFE